jgi:hypothetical protein
MQIVVGDRIVVESERASQAPRRGVIEEVLSLDPPRFYVHWSDGRTSIFTPNAGVAQIERGGRRRGGAARLKPGNEGGKWHSSSSSSNFRYVARRRGRVGGIRSASSSR